MCLYLKIVDGFEMYIGVNYLGYFFLIYLLLEKLKELVLLRIVNVFFFVYYLGRIYFYNLQGEKFYNVGLVYCYSKLVNIFFIQELVWRLKGFGVMMYFVYFGIV